MGSQNWWFGDPRTLLYTSKPLYRRYIQFRIFISWISLGYCSCVWKALPRALQETSNVGTGTPCHQSKSDVCERHLYRYPQITFLSSLLVPRTLGFTTRKPIVLSNITSVRCVLLFSFFCWLHLWWWSSSVFVLVLCGQGGPLPYVKMES